MPPLEFEPLRHIRPVDLIRGRGNHAIITSGERDGTPVLYKTYQFSDKERPLGLPIEQVMALYQEYRNQLADTSSRNDRNP